MQIVYIVTGRCDSTLGYMLAVALSAAKRYAPDARKIVLCDEVFFRSAQSETYPARGLHDECLRIDVPSEYDISPAMRSRFIKTSMRRWVSGAFVFLDIDAIPVASIDDLAETRGSCLRAAREFNAADGIRSIPPAIPPLYKRLEWQCGLKEYFNSGVLVVDESAEAEKVFDEWHRKWRQSTSAGTWTDQAAFNSAITELGVTVGVLAPDYNAMVGFFPWRMRSCKVAHFFQSGKLAGTLLEHLVGEWRRTGGMDWRAFENATRIGSPWQPRPAAWQWRQSRHYVRAAWAKISKWFPGRDEPSDGLHSDNVLNRDVPTVAE